MPLSHLNWGLVLRDVFRQHAWSQSVLILAYRITKQKSSNKNYKASNNDITLAVAEPTFTQFTSPFSTTKGSRDD